MSTNRKRDEELLAELESLGIEAPSSPSTLIPPSPSKPTGTTSKPPPSSSKPFPGAASAAAVEDDDVLRDLQAQLAVKPTGTSRPSTPRGSSSTASGGSKRAEHTPASSGPPSGRTSEERGRGGNVNVPTAARTSGEGRAYHQGVTPEPAKQTAREEERKVESGGSGGGGGWWGGFGGLLSTATAAVKQAETLAKEISGNEEAQRWADQVRGNMKNLQSFGMPYHISPPRSRTLT